MKVPHPRVRIWLVDHCPIPLLTKPHEVFLAFAMALVGVPLSVGQVRPGSVTDSVPDWMALGWGWSLLAGGLLTLWGVFTNRPKHEWSGQLLLGWGTFFYVCALLASASLVVAGVAVAIFGGLALVSWWTSFLLTSTAYVQHRLVNAARDAHRRVQTKGSRP